MKKKIRIFISSPSDVEIERQIALQVIQRLSRKYLNNIDLKPILWEREPLLASGHFQDALDPSSADIVVSIIWSRLGSPLPDNYLGLDGRTGLTGSEWEFEQALKAHEETGKPELLVYRKTAKISADIDNIEQAHEILQQKQQVEDFFDNNFHNQDSKSTFKRAYFSFFASHEFESLLETHLQPLIEKNVTGDSASSRRWFEGSPYAGLAAYDENRQAVFFGRTRAIGEVMAQYRRQISNDKPFLMLSGMSGSGKSSLVSAGLIPFLKTPRVVDFDVGYIELMRLYPRQLTHSQGPLYALCEVLLSSIDVTELSVDAETLYEQLSQSPKSLRATFKHIDHHLSKLHTLHADVQARIQIIIDQAEEIFVLDIFSLEQQKEFWHGIQTLVNTGYVWVLGSIRSDMVGKGQATQLYQLMAGDGDYKLQPPNASEIKQIIEEPAAAAGMRFEVDEKGTSLADVILDDSLAQPGSLPLVQFCLDELFRLSQHTTTEQTQFTFADYHQNIGGLAGAISQRAEAVTQTLAEQSLDVDTLLPTLFNAMVQINPDDANAVATARSVPLTHFSAQADMQQVIDAFIQSRLIAASEQHLRFAHEALIGKWQRIQDWLVTDKQFQLFKTHIERDVALWKRDDRPRARLLRQGSLLAEAKNWLLVRRDDLPPDVVDFILSSIAKEKYKTLRRRAIVSIAFIALLGFTTLLWNQHQQATENLAQAFRNQSIYLADQANKALAQGRGDTALLLALNALPGIYGGDRPEKEVARSVLSNAVANNKVMGSFYHYGWINAVTVSPNGEFLVTGGDDKLAKVWEVTTGKQRNVFEHESYVFKTKVSNNNRLLATTTYEGALTVWDLEQGRKQFASNYSDGLTDAIFSPDSKQVAIILGEPFTVLIDVHTGQEIHKLQHDSEVVHVAFSPSGERIATASTDQTLALWQTGNGEQIQEFTLDAAVNHVNFSADGQLLLISAGSNVFVRPINTDVDTAKITLPHDEPIVETALTSNDQYIVSHGKGNNAFVWSLAEEALLHTLRHQDGITSIDLSNDKVLIGTKDGAATLWQLSNGQQLQAVTHSKGVTSVALSPDGTKAFSGSADGTAVLWQANFKPDAIRPHTASIYDLDISHDGKLLASSAEDNSVAIWSLDTNQVRHQLPHDAGVYMVEFNTNASQLVTACLDGIVRLWDVASGQVSRQFQHVADIWEAHFSRDGRYLYTLGLGDIVTVWDLASGDIALQTKFDEVVHIMDTSYSGEAIAIATAKGTISVWSIATKQRLHQFQHSASIWDVRFSPDDQYIAASSSDGNVIAWSLDSGEKVFQHLHKDDVWTARFSPDGQYLLTASLDNTAQLLALPSGEPVLTVAQQDNVLNAEFSADSSTITVLSVDGNASIWSVATKQQLGTLRLFDNSVRTIISDDGKSIISGNADGKVTTYSFTHIVSVDEATKALPNNRKCLTPAERKNYFLPALSAAQWVDRGCPHFAVNNVSDEMM